MLVYVLFVAGLALLWKGADALVDGGVGLARRLGVSSFVVALTLVSFGTSVPELAVSLFAAARGETTLALANVLGSNVANVLLILGVGAVVAPISVRRDTVRLEIPFSAAAALIVAFLANDAFGGLGGASGIGRVDAVVLLALLGLFLWYASQLGDPHGDPLEDVKTRSTTVSVLLMVAGLGGLVLGATWIVDGAIAMSTAFGINDTVVGAGIVAVGTSLPELATTVAAARGGRSDVAVGNVVGSNVFNLCLILPGAALVTPIPLAPTTNLDVGAVVLSSAAILVLLRRRETFERRHGVALLLGYVAYAVSLGLRA